MNSGFDEHDLMRALNAPATPAELADESTYRALFRAEGPAAVPSVTLLRPVSGRTVRRVGTASTLAAVFALAGAGVAAAAYSSHLPTPVQGAVHRVLGPIGVPPADRQAPVDQVQADQVAPPQPEAPPAPAPTEPTAEPSASPTGEPAASPTTTPEATVPATPDATVSPEAAPTGAPAPLPTGAAEPATPAASESPTATPSGMASPSSDPTASPSTSPSTDPTGSPSNSPSSSPAGSPDGSPTASPSATAAPPLPAVVSIEAAVGHRVAPGQTTVFSGFVSAPDGSAVPHARVVLQEQTATGWREVGEGTTAKDGTVSLASAPAARTARYRIKVQDVRSAAWRLVLKPTLTASSSTADGAATVSASVTGGRPGSPVLLMTRRGGQQVVVASTSLGADGQVRFTVPAPAAQSWYVVRIVPTGAHAAASTRVLVAPGAPQPSVTPSP